MNKLQNSDITNSRMITRIEYVLNDSVYIRMALQIAIVANSINRQPLWIGYVDK